MTTTTASPAPGAGRKAWFGHPRQLSILFTTEMWERFGFYGMRALLVLYLVQHFVFSDRVANGLYGAYMSLVYLTPLIGGLVADQYFGSKKAVKFGAILMSAGYLLMAFSGGDRAAPYVEIGGTRYAVEVDRSGAVSAQYVIEGESRYRIRGNEDGSIALEGAGVGALPAIVPATDYRFDAEREETPVILLFVALGLVVVGNGYFKPNISTMVGSLYQPGDVRRDSGFTIFYMGINIGSFVSQTLSPLVVVWTGEFKWGFALAGVGMLLSWARIQLASKSLADVGNPPPGAKKRDFSIILFSLLAVPVAWFLLNNAMAAASVAREVAATGVVGYILAQPFLGKVMIFVFLASTIGIPLYCVFTATAVERDRMIIAILLTTFSVVFWTLFEQAGSSLTLFAERNTDRAIGDYIMPAAQTQIFNPFFIVTFAPIFTILWVWLGKRGLEPSAPLKFAIGLLLVGIGFLALVFGAQFADERALVPLFWLGLAYFFHSVGELCVSPVGLSMITKLSLARLVGMMMGFWFFSYAMAQYAAGLIAQFASTETAGGEVLNARAALETSLGVFQTIGVAGVAVGLLLMLLSPLLAKGMHGVR